MVRRFWVVLAPVLVLAVIVGCSSRRDDEPDPIAGGGAKRRDGGGASSLEPITAKATTTIKGRVLLKEGSNLDLDALGAPRAARSP